MTLLGRSLSVDTDRFMRHLQRKGQNYDVLRSLDKHHSLRAEALPYMYSLVMHNRSRTQSSEPLQYNRIAT